MVLIIYFSYLFINNEMIILYCMAGSPWPSFTLSQDCHNIPYSKKTKLRPKLI